MPGGVDPIYQQQQQQYFYNKGLERAKKAQRERKVSRVKPGFILAVAFVLVLAALFVLLGGLGIFDHQHVMVDGISYRIGSGGENSVVVTMDEGFIEAGTLFYTEDWKTSEQNFATDWDYETTVYVNPDDRSKVYFRWQGHYLECRREKNIFLK